VSDWLGAAHFGDVGEVVAVEWYIAISGVKKNEGVWWAFIVNETIKRS